MITQEGIEKMVPFPIALEWRITDFCNLRCSYCSSYKPGKVCGNYRDTVEKINRLGPAHVWIGGGEPAMVDELPLIVKRLKKKINPHIAVNTNLTRPDIINSALAYIDDLIVSVDTADQGISRKVRGVNPLELIDSLKKLYRRSARWGMNVNFTVMSVVFDENVDRLGGILRLNDELNKTGNICHMFCPLYPANQPGSVIEDRYRRRKFFGAFNRLREKGRRVEADFPGFDDKPSRKPVKCFRRYFRVQLIENGEFFSPCPPADPQEPLCSRPCNCAGFIGNIIKASSPEDIRHSPIAGRLCPKQADSIADFMERYTGRRVGHILSVLKKN